MSNARKCNKCHKCFDPLETTGLMTRFPNPVFMTANDIREHVIGSTLTGSDDTTEIIDLCPKCTELFRDFMKSGVKIKTEKGFVEASDLIRALFMGGDYDGDV